MEIEFYCKPRIFRKIPDGHPESLKQPLRIIFRITFCCEEMANEITQQRCWLPTNGDNEIWFNHSPAGEGFEYYIRFCPFCGTKIKTIEIQAMVERTKK